MKKKLIKISIGSLFLLLISVLVTAQKAESVNAANTIKIQPISYVSKISKSDIIIWLQNLITPNTLIRNKFISDILENSMFNQMYIQKISVKGNIIIVPLKNSYFSQHINKNEQLPFQNLIVDIDKNDKIFTTNLSLVYTADNKLKTLPFNTYNNFYSQNDPLDGTYSLISIITADYKVIEIDVKNNQRVLAKQWRSKKLNNTMYDWFLETTDILGDKDGSIIKLNTTSKSLGTSLTVSPPMFKGDLRENEK